MSDDQFPTDFPPPIFPGQPIPPGLGEDVTPPEERAAQEQANLEREKAEAAAPDARTATETSGLVALIQKASAGPAKTDKERLTDMLEAATAAEPLAPEEVQQLREMLYAFHQRQRDRFDLPELAITDKDRELFAECVLQHRPYKETFSLMKGKLKITLREKYKHETDEVFAQIDQHFREGRVRSEAAFATFVQNYSLLFQLVDINGAPLPRIKPVSPAADWTLEKALKGHVIDTFSEYTMFVLLNVWMQFDRKVQKMAQEVVSENFSVPAASS